MIKEVNTTWALGILHCILSLWWRQSSGSMASSEAEVLCMPTA